VQSLLRAGEQPVFVGIDWGGSHHQVCVVDAAGVRRRQVRLAHDVAGLARLDQELGRLGAGLPVAVERAEGLLVEHLQAGGHAVYPVSPRIAARARERYRTASSKDDVFDAFVLADTLRHEHAHWRPLPRCSPLLAELRALTRDRDRLLATQQRTEAQLRAILEAYHPAPARLFSSLDRQVTLAFIADYPTPQAAAVVGEQRMARFLARNRYTGRVKPEVLVERLRANLLAGAPGTVAGKAHSALVFAELLGLLNQQLADYDDAIAVALERHPDAAIFASFPGVGLIGTAVLLAEIGEDRAHYPTVEILLAEAGLAPVTRASGRSCRVRFRYAANRNLREACTWWAYNSLKESTWASDAYRQARARGQHPYRALRGLGARWMRVLWRCWTDRVPYDPAKHRKPTAQPADQEGATA
jgi:Transposase/Transposase IS116/IS110/IS902 family